MYACPSKPSITTRDLVSSVQEIYLGEGAIFPSGYIQVAVDLTQLRGSSGLQVLQLQVFGKDLKVDFLGVEENLIGDFQISAQYTDEDALTLNLPTYLFTPGQGEYLFLNFSSSGEANIFASLTSLGETFMYFSVNVPFLAEGVLYSIPVFTPTKRFYYYCEATSGFPQVFVTNFDNEVRKSSVSLSQNIAGIVSMPDDLADTIFFTVYAAEYTPIEDLICALNPLVYASGNVSAIAGVTDVLYQLSINPNVDELVLTSALGSPITLFFVTNLENVYLEPPIASGTGSLVVNLRVLDRTDLAFVKVEGASSDFGVEAIVNLYDSEPRFNSLRVSKEGSVQDLGYTYVFQLSADFNENSSLHIEVVSDSPQYLAFQFESGVVLFCGNDSSSFRPNCTLDLPANLISSDSVRFRVGIREDLTSITLDVLVSATERIFIRQLGQQIQGIGENDEINYFFTVPSDYKQYALLVETSGVSKSYQVTGLNSRTGELFSSTERVPSFGLVVLPGDLIELKVRSDNRGFTIKLLNMSIPDMMVESADDSMTTFDKGVFQMDLVVQPPARFFTPSADYVQAIIISALADEPLWFQVYDQVFADFDINVSWEPFGNRISLSLLFPFNETVSNDYLCVRFAPPSSVIVPNTESTAPPFCWSCPKDSCGKYCGGCSPGSVCRNMVCKKTGEPPTVVATPIPVPVPVPVNVEVPVQVPVPTVVFVPNPVPVNVPNPVPVPVPTVVNVPNPVPVIVEVPVPIEASSGYSVAFMSSLLFITLAVQA